MSRQSWDSYERAAERGPMAFAVKVGIAVALLVVLFGGLAYVFGWFSEAAVVAQEEFGAREALRKYEWFKDAAAQLDAKRADIELRQRDLDDLANSSYGSPEEARLLRSELFGIRASYNRLAAEYNGQMAKVNWRFAEEGRLPEGAAEPLPREFKPYVTGGAQ